MKLQYCSDLHLEKKANSEFIKKNPIKPIGEILVLAGDIAMLKYIDENNDFFDYISDNFKQTYWIPGNHEYYGMDIGYDLHGDIRHNVSFLNNQVVEIEKTRIVFSTLWSKISIQNQWNIQQAVKDFSVIDFNGAPFLPEHSNQFHRESLDFIKSVMKNEFDGKSIIVTHHAPTFMNFPEKYKSSRINEAFATELYYLIEELGADYWIYGHVHRNVQDFKIGSTVITTNQLGYVDGGDCHLDYGKIIEL